MSEGFGHGRRASSGAYQRADAAVCAICGEPLDDERPWQQGFEGGGAHLACLEETTEGEED